MFDVGSILLGGLGVTYEHKINDSCSFAIPVMGIHVKDDDQELTAGEIGFQFKWYFSEDTKACHGNYTFGTFSLVSGDYEERDSNDDVIAEEHLEGYTLEGGIGYMGIWESGFCQSIQFGLEFGDIRSSDDYYENDRYYGTRLRITWALGFTF